MPHKPSEIAEVKLMMLEIYSVDPNITDRQMMRALLPQHKIDYRTVGKYREQIQTTLERIKAQVEQKIEAKLSIWDRITSKLLPSNQQQGQESEDSLTIRS